MKTKEMDAICLDIRDFAEMVSRAVSEKLGERHQVKLQEVIKNNGVVLQGLVILSECQNLSPTIYLNYFLEAYRAGTPLARVVEEVLKIYEEDTPKTSVNMDFFRDFDAVRSGICYKLINRERNRMLLERIPHIDFLDLSICFFYAYRDEAVGSGSILIHNNHVDMWGCSTELLVKLAQENTRRIFPWELHDMEELLKDWIDEERAEENSPAPEDGHVPLRVLCNAQRTGGAACMIYPGVLSQLAEREADDLYILPSSIHEVIIMPAREADDVGRLLDMVREINGTQVAPEEVLSDNLYFYDRLANRVEMIQE